MWQYHVTAARADFCVEKLCVYLDGVKEAEIVNVTSVARTKKAVGKIRTDSLKQI